MSVKTKIVKARIKLFFTKSRFIESYKAKKGILGVFLLIVNAFVVWNISMNIPEVQFGIKWDNEPIIISQEVKAEVKKEIKTCEDAVEVFGEKYGNTDLISRIVDAESKGDHKAKSKISTASGCMQFVNMTWHRYGLELWGEDFYQKNIYSPKDNVELGAYVLNKYGSKDWEASRIVWSK